MSGKHRRRSFFSSRARERARVYGMFGQRALRLEPLEPRTLLSITLGTDAFDYLPAQAAMITASGLQAGEQVQFQVVHDPSTPGLPGGAGHDSWVVTDGGLGDLDGVTNGTIQTAWYVNPDDSANCAFLATATGLSSGQTAQTTFMDGPNGFDVTNSAGDPKTPGQPFPLRTDVYITGHDNGNQVDDGWYYVKVVGGPSQGAETDLGESSGADLHVVNHTFATGAVGDFAGTVQVWSLVQKTSDGSQGFDLTSANSPVYKVLLSPDGDFTNNITGAAEFKINEVGYNISGTKYEDVNGDGNTPGDADDLVLNSSNPDYISGGVTIQLIQNGNVIQTTHTGTDGTYEFGGVAPGTYTVKELVPTGWTETAPTPVPPGTYSVTVVDQDVTSVDFADFKNVVISGTKWEDHNGDGVRDPVLDEGLKGWTINIGNQTATTDDNGNWSITVGPGTFAIQEASANQPWSSFTETSGQAGYSITTSSGHAEYTGNDFANFKLGGIYGWKYDDITENGFTDDDPKLGTADPNYVSVEIDLYKNGAKVATTQTDDSGYYSFGALGPGTYYVVEQVPAGWKHTDSRGEAVDPTNPLTLTSGYNSAGNDFDNFKYGQICGIKYHDLTGDGFSNDDPTLDGTVPGQAVEFDLYKNGVKVATTTQGADGTYCFPGLDYGSYYVIELPPAHWFQTDSRGDAVDPQNPLTVTSGTASSGNDFDNVHLGQAGGLTLGFYSNKNGNRALTGSLTRTGTTLLDSIYTPLVAALNNPGDSSLTVLVDASGNYVAKSSLQSFAYVSNYLLSASATNMANMLSAQLLTTEFNVLLGLSASQSIWVPAVTIPGSGQPLSSTLRDSLTANGIGDAVQVQTILDKAIAELYAQPNTTAAGPDRTYEEALKDLFDAINNNETIFII